MLLFTFIEVSNKKVKQFKRVVKEFKQIVNNFYFQSIKYKHVVSAIL